MIFIRAPYAYDEKSVSDDTAIVVEGETLAQQQFAEECDINTIVNRFLKTGELPTFDARAQFGDFIDMPDSYQEALEAVRNAQKAFSELPSSIRARFYNDPAQLLLWLSDPKNVDEAVKLGLMTKSVAVEQPDPTTGEAGQATKQTSSVEPGTVGPT